jgi:hypothetical protein
MRDLIVNFQEAGFSAEYDANKQAVYVFRRLNHAGPKPFEYLSALSDCVASSAHSHGNYRVVAHIEKLDDLFLERYGYCVFWEITHE